MASRIRKISIRIWQENQYLAMASIWQVVLGKSVLGYGKKISIRLWQENQPMAIRLLFLYSVFCFLVFRVYEMYSNSNKRRYTI